jgi:hypothetical protein
MHFFAMKACGFVGGGKGFIVKESWQFIVSGGETRG